MLSLVISLLRPARFSLPGETKTIRTKNEENGVIHSLSLQQSGVLNELPEIPNIRTSQGHIVRVIHHKNESIFKEKGIKKPKFELE